MKKFFSHFKEEWSKNDLFNWSATIAFYTIFSLPPILILLINLSGFFFEEQDVRNEIISKAQVLIGYDKAMDLESIMNQVAYSGSNLAMQIIGVATLLFGATTVIIALQQALNAIWEVKSKEGFLKNLLVNRALSFSIVLSFGFVMIVSLFLESAINLIMNTRGLETLSFLSTAINHIIGIAVILILFMFIYKILPNRTVPWKTALKSSSISTFLFYVGRFLISLYLSKSSVLTIYGAAGSFIIIPVWIYYSSFIFLLGALLSKILVKKIRRFPEGN